MKNCQKGECRKAGRLYNGQFRKVETRAEELHRSIQDANAVIRFNVGHGREETADFFRAHVDRLQAELQTLTEVSR